jgi:hypothetical protein
MANGSRVLVEEPGIDLEIVEGMIPELDDYIIKDEVYRTVIIPTSAGDQNIRMTGGDLLARLHRLNSERDALTPAQQQRLDAAQSRADESIRSLKTRFHQRLQREMKARLDSLKWFLDENENDRQRARVEFPFEMRNRQRIEEILKRLGNELPEDLATSLRQVDRRIRDIGRVGGFIWSERAQKIYPQDTYWYLYMLP